MWLKHGGESSRKSYESLSEDNPDGSREEQHIRFFEKLENYYIDSENRLYCHAGFTHHNGQEYEYYSNTI